MSCPGDAGTLRGSIGGYAFIVSVVETEDALFEYTAEIEGQSLWGEMQLPIRSKGDAMQLGMAAVEACVAALPKRT